MSSTLAADGVGSWRGWKVLDLVWSRPLTGRFGVDRVDLVGQSWGSALGVMAPAERPDLYHAFVGVGQMVSFAATDRMFWEDALAWAESRGDTRLANQLRENGPPPTTTSGSTGR